jgi:SAM-dependent MidA family methyltransferase
MFDQPLPLDIFFSLSVEKYYRNRENCIGRSGDFITAPEASQMFCHAVGVWVYNQIYNYKGKISLVELGGGYGTLMNDTLNLLRREIIPSEVYFIEASPKMIERQKKAVASHTRTKFHWFDSIDKIPSDIKHIVIANEFFDALPVKQFINCNGNFRELYISQDMALIQSQDVISNQEMYKIMQYSNSKVEDFNHDDIFELSTTSLTAIDKICKIAHAALIIDYGYYNSNKKNTIKAIDNHTILDSFLITPGSADISAEVDFGSMDNFIKKHYSTYNTHYTTQKDFLYRNHLEEIVNKAIKHGRNQSEVDLINSELYQISIDMGERFKVLSFNSA